MTGKVMHSNKNKRVGNLENHSSKYKRVGNLENHSVLGGCPLIG